jgi:hypothetical protein
MRNLIVCLICFGTSTVWASSPFKRSLTQKSGIYLADGLFTGGKAGGGSSLLGIRRAFSAKAELERVIIDLGDADGKPAGKRLGYFQASVDAGQKRVILDLAQLRMSKLSEAQVQGIFKGSPFVASVEFTLDPEDKAGTMVLNLKRPARLEVFELLDARKPGRIVMDIIPSKAASPAWRPAKGHG